MSAFGGKADKVRSEHAKQEVWDPGSRSSGHSAFATDLEASRERFATCCHCHENREGPTFLPVRIGRRESRPSCWRLWGVFSPFVVFAKDRSSRLFFLHARHLPKGSSSPEKTARTKLFARIDSLRTSSEPDRCYMYSCSFFAALGWCTRHEKVPPQHLASRSHRDRPRPGLVRVS